ncbi:MAG: PAS domain-containing sensor histidine kinase, partial [Candidatus Micrarchaeota archaeon]|nr:PAS domain-containing sensor histidine kinase [Candidatus Micrarchaeota archaeon]
MNATEHKEIQTKITEIENITIEASEVEKAKEEKIKKIPILNESVYNIIKEIEQPILILDERKNVLMTNEKFFSEYRVNLDGERINKYLKQEFLSLKDKKYEVETKEISLGNVIILIVKNKEKEREIEEKLEMLKIMDEINEGIIIIIRNGKIIDFNNVAKQSIPSIEIGRNIKEYIKFNKFSQKMKEIIESKSKTQMEGFLLNEKIPVSAQILLNKDKIVIIFTNKSQELKLVEEIRFVREQYEQIVNNTTDIICIIDKNGTFKFVNKQFEKQLGYKEPYPSIYQIIHPEDVPEFIRALTEHKGFQDKEFRIYNNKKKMFYFAVSALPLIHGNTTVEYSMTLRNITEKKKSEDKTVEEREKLKEEYKRLSEINRMKTEFVSMVSHDLKTPLTNIQGYASLLRNKVLGPNTPKQQEAAEIIDKEAKRLAKLINDLLDLSKLDAGAITLHKRPFKLSELEDKCSLRNMAESKGLTLIWNTPDSLGEVYGDPERIAQVLTNLVNNAIKFTDKGSVT